MLLLGDPDLLTSGSLHRFRSVDRSITSVLHKDYNNRYSSAPHKCLAFMPVVVEIYTGCGIRSCSISTMVSKLSYPLLLTILMVPKRSLIAHKVQGDKNHSTLELRVTLHASCASVTAFTTHALL